MHRPSGTSYRRVFSRPRDAPGQRHDSAQLDAVFGRVRGHERTGHTRVRFLYARSTFCILGMVEYGEPGSELLVRLLFRPRPMVSLLLVSWFWSFTMRPMWARQTDFSLVQALRQDRAKALVVAP